MTEIYKDNFFIILNNNVIFSLFQGKFNPQYMKGSPHSSQRGGGGGKRSQTPDHMLSSGDQGVEMRPLQRDQRQQQQTQSSLTGGNVQSPSVAQKVSRMGIPTPFAGVTSVPSPIR